MTAGLYSFDMKFLGETAARIINEMKGVKRVVYDVTSKPPGRLSGSEGNEDDLAGPGTRACWQTQN
jgi:hypothetical protein